MNIIGRKTASVLHVCNEIESVNFYLEKIATCYPEVFSIAKLVNVDLLACSTKESIALALDSFKTISNSKIDLDQMNKYSWESQAEKLEKTLISVIGEK